MLPDDGSRIVSPGCSTPSRSASSTILQRDAVLRRAAGVLALELGVDPHVGVRRQRVDADERRVADETEDRLVAHGATGRRQPPATAGRIEITSPSATLVSSWSRYRMSSSLRYTFTNLWRLARLVDELVGEARVPGGQIGEHLADGAPVGRDRRRAVGVRRAASVGRRTSTAMAAPTSATGRVGIRRQAVQ